MPTGKIGIPSLYRRVSCVHNIIICSEVHVFQGEVSVIRARLILSFIPHRHVSQCSIHMHDYGG